MPKKKPSNKPVKKAKVAKKKKVDLDNDMDDDDDDDFEGDTGEEVDEVGAEPTYSKDDDDF